MKGIAVARRVCLIDEYGELDRRVTAFKPTAERKLELEKEIASWYDDSPADEEFVLEGRSYSVQISARAVKRTIFDMAKLFLMAGKARFLQICTVPMKAIDREFPAEKRKAFLSEERTGRRSVAAVAKEGLALRRAA